jgi:hypothetical protein
MYIALHNRMINELERMWKEAVVTHFKIISRLLPGKTEGNC